MSASTHAASKVGDPWLLFIDGRECLRQRPLAQMPGGSITTILIGGAGGLFILGGILSFVRARRKEQRRAEKRAARGQTDDA